ncbi:MAG: hypothetical protein K6B75_09105 [Lachnospiraceae bacterium]|nr:hypothetical protein [Lachnospiraceae bacterium]
MGTKDIPIILMLVAGLAVCITCISKGFPIQTTFLFVAITLFVFYFLGRIIKKIIDSINKDAENRATLAANEKKLEEERLEAERQAAELTEKMKETKSSEEDENGLTAEENPDESPEGEEETPSEQGE